MKKLNRIIFLILLFVGILNAQIIDILTAPKFSISGKVVDIKEGTPLVGANVYLARTSHGTATTEEGLYNISGVRTGSYLVKVTYIGYTMFEDSITIIDENLSKDFALSYTSIQGEEVVVTGLSILVVGDTLFQVKGPSSPIWSYRPISSEMCILRSARFTVSPHKKVV